METKFDLTFIEDMNAVLAGKYIQGENFIQY